MKMMTKLDSITLGILWFRLVSITYVIVNSVVGRWLSTYVWDSLEV